MASLAIDCIILIDSGGFLLVRGVNMAVSMISFWISDISLSIDAFSALNVAGCICVTAFALEISVLRLSRIVSLGDCPHENLSAFSSEYIISDELIGLMRGDPIFHEPVHIV